MQTMTVPLTSVFAAAHAETLASHYRRIRATTRALCTSLRAEDTVVQSMPETSPTKWHLAHTSWFFEQFVLSRNPRYKPLHADWLFLFNSYYQSIGPMHARTQRGLLTRPTFDEVLEYRQRIDDQMQTLLQTSEADAELRQLVLLGLNHEQQHQELLLTDIKHAFSLNPLEPIFREALASRDGSASPLRWIYGDERIVEIGHTGDEFSFDNEGPRHRALLQSHAIANRPISNAEFGDFIRDGGYRTPTLWMAEGWATVQAQNWQRPLYWSDDLQSSFTLGGRVALNAHAPVCHVSFFEADAFARWAGARLPTETEWETVAAAQHSRVGNFLDSGYLQPQPFADSPDRDDAPRQMFGDVWEWTSSPYVNYPRYRPVSGALGEYNGKFMCGQWVLRGGSCITPADHIRATYRNFFYPADRWQFMGFRLGRDA